MRATTAYWAKRVSSISQNRPVAKARIGPHPNFSDITARGGQKTGGQKFFTARPGSRIAAPQLDIQRNEEFASTQSSGSSERLPR